MGHALFVRHNGRRAATPLFGALTMVASFDAVFALDSIPAILGVTREVFLVAAANAFSLLGLAALYFTLAGMLERFRDLRLGIAVVLVLVGVKMVVGEFVDVPAYRGIGRRRHGARKRSGDIGPQRTQGASAGIARRTGSVRGTDSTA